MLLQLKLDIPWEDIVFFSDPHYGHKNIVKGVSSWKNTSRCRDFKSVPEHNDALVTNINQVASGKTALCLGDWSFGGKKNIKIFRDRLQVKELHLIVGNHDHHIIKNKDNEQDLFDSVNMRGEIYVNGQLILLQHRAERVWEKSHKGSWMLYGHSHGNLQTQKTYDIAKTMDVGLDAHSKFRPFTGREVHTIMKDRELLTIDHHM